MVRFFEGLARGENVNEYQGIVPVQTILTVLVFVLVGSVLIFTLGSSVTTALDSLEVDLLQASQVQLGKVSQ